MKIIEVVNLFKSYGQIEALKNINLEVEKGSCFALIGPNGAGKTTFVKSLLNLVRPLRGTIRINGINSEDEKARNGVYFLPEKFTFYSYYTVTTVLEFFAKMQQARDVEDNIKMALKRLSIEDIADRKLNTLSKGQLQRVGIANIFVGNHEIFFFDEPFSGLDPLGIKDLKEIIRELNSLGKTVFINSHILAEMEKLCDSFGIINRGELVDSGKMNQKLNGQSLENYFYQKVSANG